MADQILRKDEVAILHMMELEPNRWFFLDELGTDDHSAQGILSLERLGLIERIGTQEFFRGTHESQWNWYRYHGRAKNPIHYGVYPELLTDGNVRWVDHDGEEFVNPSSRVEDCFFPFFRITGDGINAIRWHDAKSTRTPKEYGSKPESIPDVRHRPSSPSQIPKGTQTTDDSARTSGTDWKQQRKRDGITVNEQLTAIYLRDPRCRGLQSPELSEILQCSARQVRSTKAYKAASADAEHRRLTGGI